MIPVHALLFVCLSRSAFGYPSASSLTFLSLFLSFVLDLPTLPYPCRFSLADMYCTRTHHSSNYAPRHYPATRVRRLPCASRSDMNIFKKVFVMSKETNELVSTDRGCRPCSDQMMKQRRSATIQVKITESYQLCKATQHWLLEVVQFAVETAPLLPLLASISVQSTRVFVKRKTRVTETLLDRTTEIRRIIAHLI